MSSRVMHGGPPDGTQSVQRVLGLLRMIALHNRVRIVDLCRLTGLRRPTLHRLLQCLAHENPVGRDPRSRNYHLGQRRYELGLSGPDAICLDRQEGPRWIRALTLDVGTRRPLGAGAGSLAIPSALPRERIREAVNANGDRLGDYDGLTVHGSMGMIRQSRARGFALHDGSTGARAIGVPIYDSEGAPVAAISASAHVQRMPEARWPEIGSLLRAKAKSVERTLAQACTQRRKVSTVTHSHP